MMKSKDERFDRAVAALDAVVAQTSGMTAGYKDALVFCIEGSPMRRIDQLTTLGVATPCS